MENQYLDDEALSAYWRRQREAILTRAQTPAPRPLARAAAAFAMVAMVAALVVAPEAPPPALTASDDALLRDIDLLVSRLEPRALEPARLLLPEEFKEVVRR